MFGIGRATRPETAERIAAFALGAGDGDLAPAGRERGPPHRLAAPFADAPLRAEIVAAVAALEDIQVADLTRLLARARPT